MGRLSIFGQIEVVVDEVRQHMVEGTALVRNLKADTHLSRVPPEDFLIRHDDETG